MQNLQVSKKPLRRIKAHEQGKYLVVGGDDGTISILQVSDDLTRPDKNEKKDMLEVVKLNNHNFKLHFISLLSSSVT